jgi:NitT/TauT family transport system substrate-binding protein
LYFLTAVLVVASCGPSYEEKRRTIHKERMQRLKEDSAALKVAVMPTMDCLPLFVAKAEHLFSGADVRLKLFTAQMDIDTALSNHRVEAGVSDLVRIERLKKQGDSLRYLTATNAYWQLVTNRSARILDFKHLDDKMLAMTRYSVTDLLGDLAVDSGKLKSERVFRIQINDVNVRLKMLENNEMDALVLTEPQAAQARLLKHHVLMDTRKLDMAMGVIVSQWKDMDGESRAKQMRAFMRGYNRACDSLNKYGLENYASLIVKYCRVKPEAIKQLDKDMKFPRIALPLEADVERAKTWLSKK